MSEAAHAGFQERVVDASRFWERRRLLFNVVVGVATLVPPLAVLAGWRETAALSLAAWLLLLLLVGANLIYSAIYPVDLALQGPWRRARASWRPPLWLAITLLGAAIAGFCSWLLVTSATAAD